MWTPGSLDERHISAWRYTGSYRIPVCNFFMCVLDYTTFGTLRDTFRRDPFNVAHLNTHGATLGPTLVSARVSLQGWWIDIESSELKAAEIVEHDDTKELVPKRGAVSVWRFFGSKNQTSTKQPFYASVVRLKLTPEVATQACLSTRTGQFPPEPTRQRLFCTAIPLEAARTRSGWWLKTCIIIIMTHTILFTSYNQPLHNIYLNIITH